MSKWIQNKPVSLTDANRNKFFGKFYLVKICHSINLHFIIYRQVSQASKNML
jgi:hypothetical protein